MDSREFPSCLILCLSISTNILQFKLLPPHSLRTWSRSHALVGFLRRSESTVTLTSSFPAPGFHPSDLFLFPDSCFLIWLLSSKPTNFTKALYSTFKLP
ncbi:UNVERIFIED_CONTAM: hypothetical protein FKN15_070207 [Acipenser sinensis]